MKAILKISCCFIVSMMLLACKSGSEGESGAHDAFLYPYGHVCQSEDGRVTILSGDTPTGGTCMEYWAKWAIVDEFRGIHELRFDNTVAYREVHSLKRSDGTVQYIAVWNGRYSSGHGCYGLSAYVIEGDTVREVNVIDGGDEVDTGNFVADFQLCDWSDATNGVGFDWMFEYDAESRVLYVPIVRNDQVTDRYIAWYFNGERFVRLGERAHRNLHEELREYVSLACYFTTNDYIVRVDELEGGEMRYSSWKRPKGMSDKPDLVVRGGVGVKHPDYPDEPTLSTDYRFKNDGYEYIVNYGDPSENDWKGGYKHYLLVRKGDEVVLQQEQEWSLNDKL